MNAQADELLQKQSDANKKLWEMIELNKKKYFSPEAVAEREAAIEAAIEANYQAMKKENRAISSFYESDDDLPF